MTESRYAFPRMNPSIGYNDCGMTLRDYFAAQAIVGVITTGDQHIYDQNSDLTVDQWRANCLKLDADYCYRMADAMLSERAKTTSAAE